MPLDRMEPADVAELVRTKLVQLLGEDAEPGAPLVELVAARSEGNPFYVEELLNYIVAQGIDGSDPAALESVRLPESLHSLVLSRIDAAAEGPRRTMKVASVVGRVFTAPTLPGAYEELGSVETVLDDLDALRALDLVALDREAEQAWMFKHMVTQEVAYESLPFALRALLHGLVGDYIERAEADDVDRYVPLLEHHYWRSDRGDKKREYLRRAAEQAQASYANNAAIAYYDRLIPLLAEAERVEALLGFAKVLQVAGQLGRAEEIAADARMRSLELGDRLQAAWAEASVAETAKRQSRYDEATTWLEHAMEGFREHQANLGVGDMLHLAGVIAQLTGDYATAQARYTEARRVREAAGDVAGMATTEGNLAILAEFAGDNAKALEINDSSLTLRRRIGDRRGIGIGEMNSGYYRILTGDLPSAREHLEEALRLSLEMGDRAMIAHSTFTLGNVFRDLGEHAAAARQYVDAIHRQRDLDDRFSLTFILEDAGVLLARTGDPAAGLELLGGAEAIRNQIGSPRPPSLEAELAESYRPARETLGLEASDAAVARGRAWSYEQAVQAAIAACSIVAGAATGLAAD
jgi:predicted ATPase